MPKLKSHSGASKRFRTTGSGKVKRRRAFRSHILTKMSPKQKRQLRGSELTLKKCDERLAKRMLQGS